MDAVISLLFSDYGVIALAVAGVIGLTFFAGTLKQKADDNADQRARDEKALRETNAQLERINEIQANPFPDAKSANGWLSKFRAKRK